MNEGVEGESDFPFAPFHDVDVASTLDASPDVESFSPAVDLVRSGRMSHAAFLLPHEAADGHLHAFAAGSGGDANGGSPSPQQQQRRALENAARVALLVARSYVQYLDSLSGSSREDAFRQLSTLQLGDVFVNLGGGNAAASGDGNGGDSSVSPTLLGADVIAPVSFSPLGEQDEQQPNSFPPRTPFLILGKLLYSTFSRGESPPPDMFDASANQSSESRRDENGYLQKSFRATGSSLFSRLVESKSFPLSICRLLSDLDSNAGDTSESSYAKLDEVVEDLEQMIAQPDMFLHNAYYPRGMPEAPVFGRVYHGRKEETAALLNVVVEMQQSDGPCDFKPAIESVWVSGIGGSGKSALVQTVQDYLTSLGWMTIKAKFDRSSEHASRGIVSSMFDGLISDILAKKDEGSPSDVEYARRVSGSIFDAIGTNDLARLATFMPSLPLLLDENVRSRSVSPVAQVPGEISNGQLVYALSKILDAVLEHDKFIMVCCDDLQWADKTSLALITELLIHLGGTKHVRRHCLFVGLFREDEINNQHPLSTQYAHIQSNAHVNTSEIKLSTLSKDDVVDMLMMELRLQRRLVVELADAVYKKTAGHAFYIVQVLNSLVNDSIIAYSTLTCRYYWDIDRVDMMQPGENAAEFIASRVSSFPMESQRFLHILSCFGIQVDDSLLQLIEEYQQGVIASIDSFIEIGIVDRAGPIVMFTHDLIQQAIYESMTSDQRQELHLGLGLFLGTRACANDSLALNNRMSQLQLDRRNVYSGRSLESPLIAIACDSINSVGPDVIVADTHKVTFAQWNLSAGQKTSRNCDFYAALHYFAKGIDWLGDKGWSLDPLLCLELHNGAVAASFSLSEEENVAQYAQEIIAHATFENALQAQTILLSYEALTGKHKECISRATELLGKLGFKFPSTPTKESIMDVLTITNGVASQYNADQILALCERPISDKIHSVVKIMDAFHRSCYALSSPLLPLISCEIVRVSLQFGICPDAATAFATYAVTKVNLEQDHEAGRYWATVVKNICEKHKAKKSSRFDMMKFDARALILLFVGIDIWFQSPRDISTNLLEYYEAASRTGRTDLAMIALRLAWRYKFLGGENLSLIQQKQDERLEELAEYNKGAARFAVMDSFMLSELTGKACKYDVEFGDTINSIDDLQADAESRKNNRMLHHIHTYKMMLGFWKGDLVDAEKSSRLAWTFPWAKKSEIMFIYHTLFSGLVAFSLYRQFGDDKRLKEGSEAMDRLRNWTYNSMPVFENKWLLLKAEYLSSFRGGSDDIRKLYEASIKAARDHGNIHECAIAQQLLGDYFGSRGCTSDSKESYLQAYESYKQWGATTLAENLLAKHKLAVGSNGASKLKRERG